MQMNSIGIPRKCPVCNKSLKSKHPRVSIEGGDEKIVGIDKIITFLLKHKGLTAVYYCENTGECFGLKIPIYDRKKILAILNTADLRVQIIK